MLKISFDVVSNGFRFMHLFVKIVCAAKVLVDTYLKNPKSEYLGAEKEILTSQCIALGVLKIFQNDF